MKFGGIEKAAMLLMTVDEDVASKIFDLMDDDEIREISHCMSNLGNITPEHVETLLKEFSQEINDNLSFVGNVYNTERFLRKVLGNDKVDLILEDIKGPAGKNIWDKLYNVNEEILANYLKKEYPQTAALILSKLSPPHSAKILALLPQDFAFEIVQRMLKLDSVKKEVLEKIEKSLRTEFVSNLTKTQSSDNSEIIAEIFNSFDRTTEGVFMGLLEKYDGESAEKVKSLMFTFDDMVKLDSLAVQSVLKVVDKARLAIALKGAKEEVKDLFVENMSQRAAKILVEEIEGMGPVKLKVVDEAQAEIITTVKGLIERGEIELSEEDEGDLVI